SPLGPGTIVYRDATADSESLQHLSFANATAAVPVAQQYACGSGASGVNGPRANEIACFLLDDSLRVLVVAPVMTDMNAPGGRNSYGKLPKGNLDVTGQYFIWTSNMGGGRLDAFLVKVPSQLLTGASPDTTPPVVALTAPADGATVNGTVTVSATASDNVGVVGVQFQLDGATLGPEVTAAPYTTPWNTLAVVDGVHSLTAVARDAAGNFATAAAVNVTVANGSFHVWLTPEDTSLNLNAANYSGDSLLLTYTWPDNLVANAILMKFDLSSIPAGAVVQEATLQLTVMNSDASSDPAYAVTAHKMVGRNPVLSRATGYSADGTQGWTPNGCCYNNVPLAQADISPPYDTQTVAQTVGSTSAWHLAAMVQEWLADPATNFGLLLNSDGSKPRDRYRYFASTEHPTSTARPFLRVTWARASVPDTTPPSIAITTPTAGTIVSGTITVAASASDNTGVASVELRLDGASLGTAMAARLYSVSWNTAASPDGPHTLTAVARDLAGNVTTSAPVAVTVANPKRRLTVTKLGTGAGTVSSDSSTINCGSLCASSVDNGSIVTLGAAASPGSAFTGWGNACTGAAGLCTVSMDANKTVNAAFTRLSVLSFSAPTYTVSE
ncbi:MAG TPA: Ig-like domain-containing protein, partial [Mycobacteriales bacterium]|nr:Ig-like domain-containing protein [Mycobacteriales bacterium]